jgi:hypothetical protein
VQLEQATDAIDVGHVPDGTGTAGCFLRGDNQS